MRKFSRKSFGYFNQKKQLTLPTNSIAKQLFAQAGLLQIPNLEKKLFALDKNGYKTYAPKMKYCTDNAAMVGSCAYFNPIKCENPLEIEVFSRG